MYTLPITQAGETLSIHFVWHQSDREGAIPLLFQHGWPGNFLEVLPLIDELTSPSNPTSQAYHVVAPSLPGFVFSSCPQSPSFGVNDIAAVNHQLMQALGYDTYLAQGGDWGSIVVRIMGARYPAHCLGVHVNMLAAALPSFWTNPFHLIYLLVVWALFLQRGADSTLRRLKWWRSEESGYAEIQKTKPLTIAAALVDSPIGMLAWLYDKLHPLVDDDFVWSPEELITWSMMYLIPGTAGHALIYTNMRDDRVKEYAANLHLSPDVDFGVSCFPRDVYNIPRWWASASVSKNIVFWREHAKGGHFAALEKPRELIQDIRDFTSAVHPVRRTTLLSSGKLKK
ncbi:hypothetical protein ASPZODRAFT_136724 [Penicilliopsis zonata CBS 506.65]|uniref:AB hydrolase-1 domain-containing protein n=1 Tax=Penicilliopsis zonata CBS 506.65 TaxID=1073090 RepID=A0A1L9S7L6_9EURO|nr:hypothetical protein ASPZODRAFT_136724 [Penicilliopsis zonata CBS 506.65]OJJ43165.1 hypothetical protein ASPZODRAFT_136724 [Penicilliopsis zonata CBS 506.65]